MSTDVLDKAQVPHVSTIACQFGVVFATSPSFVVIFSLELVEARNGN
jgi:hypothetical protein